MQRGVDFPARRDPAHWVDGRGVREMYVPGALQRLNDPTRGARVQTSSRPVGLAMNLPALQQFGAPINLNAMHSIASSRSAGPNSKWKRTGGLT